MEPDWHCLRSTNTHMQDVLLWNDRMGQNLVLRSCSVSWQEGTEGWVFSADILRALADYLQIYCSLV